MKLLILIVIGTLGVIIPLFWLTGTFTSVIYFCLHRGRAGATSKEQSVAFNPQLGLTMADGGDTIDKEGKE